MKQQQWEAFIGWICSDNNPHAAVIDWKRSDFQNYVLSVLKWQEFTDIQKQQIYTILQLPFIENEKTNFLIYITPDISLEELENLKWIYTFLSEYWFMEGIIEQLEDIETDSKKVTFLQENTFYFFQEQKDIFFDTIILYLDWWDESILEQFISYKEVEIRNQKCNVRLQPLEFKDFERKVQAISRKKNIEITTKQVKTGGMNFFFRAENVINIGSWCSKWKQKIHLSQQQKAIKYLWCTRAEWIDA